ncbi:TonB-dependent receptor [Pseudomaricurvus alkylphenolicus]|uniref:TonB-dependent receptor n=1 Tax=Pseudomaricurvus alkylphenolicus TaxID=1306991 RepID=UPI0014223BCC|nr:TonB-dependent receptor [Pseudomaricurvus alkylphenolicus]NIB44915.1 TonB-dependent receptor [Pseudomaricurvus alkylphenolicus]
MKTQLNLVSALALAVSSYASSSENNFVLEEITVTAEKIGAKSVMDTAFSVTAIKGEDLETQGIVSMADALAVNPGVSVIKLLGSSNTVQIRGVSSLAGDATVGYYLDDLPYTQVGQGFVPDLNPYDLERMEVLRGPQGTLYGASSQGGTVRILTHNPEHNEFALKANLGLSTTEGAADNWKAQAAVNIPLVEDTLSARVVLSSIDNDGYIDLPLTGEENYNNSKDESYRAKLLYTPSDALTLRLSAWHVETESSLPFGDENYEFSPIYPIFDGLTGLPVGVAPVAAKDLVDNSEFDLYNVTVEYEFDAISLYSTTSLIEVDQDYQSNYLGIGQFQLPLENRTLNQELRIASTGQEALSWTAGLFYMDAQQEQGIISGTFLDETSFAILQGFDPSLTNPLLSTVQEREATTEQWAVFGEAHYQISDAWEITLGARYFEDEREEKDLEPGTAAFLDFVGVGASRSEEFDKLTGRINLSYTPDNDSLYYLNIAQGFRSGSAQQGFGLMLTAGTGAEPPLFAKEEDLISYELGAKLSFMDDALAVEAALYYLQWEDILTILSVPHPTFGSVNFVDNVGEADGLGLDLSLLYRGVPGLTLQLSANFNSTEYGEDLPSANIQDGDTVSQVPESTYTASAAYQWSLGNSGLDGYFYMAYQYADSRPDYTLGFAPTESDDMGLLNVRIGVEAETWSVFLTGENLLDEDGEVSNIASNAPFGLPANRTRPRTVGVEASFNF